MKKSTKIRKDRAQLKAYEKRLMNEKMMYSKMFEIYCVNQRKSREAGMGYLVLQAMDDVRALAKKKTLIGELYFTISEQKVRDEAGKVGFHSAVEYHVLSNEPAHDPEDVKKEIEETWERMKRETDEMYAEDDDGKNEHPEGDEADHQEER